MQINMEMLSTGRCYWALVAVGCNSENHNAEGMF